jgi:nuclear GTP-binding protein
MAPPNQGPNKNVHNRLLKTNTSSKLGVGRRKDKDPGSQRSAETIKRLKVAVNGKPIRNKRGDVVAGAFMMDHRAGDREITAQTGRIQPDRRWFGNTRVVDPKQLDNFREAMTQNLADPYSVVLKRRKLPMGLLQDAAEYSVSNNKALLESEPFDRTFGSQSSRKRVKLDQLYQKRSAERNSSSKNGKKNGNATEHAAEHEQAAAMEMDDNTGAGGGGGDGGYGALLKTAQASQSTYTELNTAEGIVPWGRDHQLYRTEGEGIDWRTEKKGELFLKGQSKRIWGEFFKVVDCSDVILHVIDARNVPGTRCRMIESHIRDHAPHKHLVFILNKIDLVPNWVAKRWMGELAKDRPTIAFHASMTQAFGKGALISLLRQFGTLHQDKKQISVGVIGYPNVGKSSVINTLISKKSCKVAPIPGETKIWQYITLFKRIALIDCPGVVVDTAGDTETDSVLKGVVRAEKLETPEDYIEAIIAKVKREHINAQYKIEDKTWSDANELMERIAIRCGRLGKGGDPCLRSAAVTIIMDYQRGRLPHFVPPPELKKEEKKAANAKANADMNKNNKIVVDKQDLDLIVEKQQEVDQVEDDNKASDSDEPNEPAAPGGSEQLIAPGDWDE